ncbi:hypothetical protein [Variovorax paradoxus]|uniref:Uncharacterized protein n=1 Tax=Variovorax paradoxus (strain EPS) TaxID=595537 RepID=E6V3T8_VARPE|nr:hypothetical protein [Variovorax paradoxus]ADU36962.1 hypothetical protein Varpa_2764 [Variovorax paradoxus EPS]
MPMDFLRRIEGATFPLAVKSESDIHCVAVLVAAQFVEAVLPPSGIEGAAKQVAIILRITPLGNAELNRMREAETD